MYIVQADIEARWGVANIAAWSQFQDGRNQTADVIQVGKAITWVESFGNRTLANGPYLVPITPLDGVTVPQELVEPLAILAGIWLYRARKLNAAKEILADINKQYSSAVRSLWAIRVGVMPIAAVLNTRRTNVPQMRGYRRAT